jgi:hypothetical protein
LTSGKTGRIKTAQEWPGHTSTAHTRAYVDAEDFREKASSWAGYLDLAFHRIFKRGTGNGKYLLISYVIIGFLARLEG